MKFLWKCGQIRRIQGFSEKFFLDVPCFFYYNRGSAHKKGEQNPEIEGGATTMKMTFQPKKNREAENMASEKE